MRRGRHAVQREQRAEKRRLRSPSTWIGAFAAACVAGAIGLSMTPAHAEAANTTATLTLTGIVDSSCDLGTGGTTAYIAPGGTVTIKASLAGATVTVPGLLGLPDTTIPLDSAKIASFVDTVVINGDKKHPRTLKTNTDKIVLKNIRSTIKLDWKATAINFLGVNIPLSGDNVNLPAGGELDWTGKIVPKANSNCGVAVAVPTTKVHAGSKTLTVPGVAVTASNPVPALTSAVGSIINKARGGASSTSAAGSGHKTSTGPVVKYTPPALTVPQQVMPHAVANGGGGGFAAPGGDAGAVVGAPVNAPAQPTVTSTAAAPTTSPAAKVKAAKTVDLASKSQLSAQQLPVLLALVAILALAMVTAVYARLYLLRRSS